MKHAFRPEGREREHAMKNNKLNMVWIAGLAALVILILLLTMCTGSKENEVETQPTETAEQQLASPVETSEPTAQTTAPSEETTAPTEETTEPTEETTEPTTGNNNSGNDNTGTNKPGSGNTGTTTPTEPPLEVPDAGTEKNPYVEVVSEYPGKVTTVSIPASGKINYLISGAAGNVISIEDPNAKLTCGDKTYTPDENGILTADLSAMTADAVIAVSNSAGEEQSYVLRIAEPLGAKTNPEPIDSFDGIAVTLKQDDADGYHYGWTATGTGTLKLSVKEKTQESAAKKLFAGLARTAQPEAVESSAAQETIAAVNPEISELAASLAEAQLEMQSQPNIDIIVTAGDKTVKLSESTDGMVAIDVEKLQKVLIQVIAVPDEAGKYPAVNAELTGSFEIWPGTQENPYEYTLAGIPDTFTTVQIPSGKQVYYNFIGAGGTVLTIADQACVIHDNVTYGPTVGNAVWVELPEESVEPVLLALGNQNTQEKALTLQFAYKGSAICPEILHAIESIQTVLEEGDADGFYYQWAVTVPGTVTMKLDSDTAADVALSVSGTDRTAKLEDTAASIEVAAGDTLRIHVSAPADETGAYPALEVSLSGSFAPAPGTGEENPLVISDTSVPTTIAVGAEKTFYLSGDFRGQILTIQDAAGAVLVCNSQSIFPDETGTITVAFPEEATETTLELTSEEDREYTLIFAYPLGTAKNPQTMDLGENRATLDENDSDGYTFVWYADIEGELTIAMPEDSSWQYTLDGVSHNSAEEPKTLSNTIAVTVGQEVLFTVNTFEPESETTPAGTVSFTVSFYDPTLGTEENPINLSLTDTITIPAGQTVYYTAKADGMTLTLTGENVKLSHNGAEYTAADGKLELLCKGAGMMMPPVFAITNLAEEEASFAVEFTYPLGHQENPAELQLGETKITLAAGNEVGFCFIWKAEESGTLTVTMAEGRQWQYVVNNLTSGVSGELHVSNDDPVVLSETVTVSSGDEISIIVNTYDPENPFSTPGGELTFQAEFIPA